MKFSIRKAEQEDAEAIAELSGQLGYKSGKDSVAIRLDGILRNDENCVFVAWKNEKIVAWIHGFYALRVESDAFVEIGGMVVAEDFRKHGIGKGLIEKVDEWAAAKGCPKLRVRCNVLRQETHQFYQKVGFELKKEQMVFDRPLQRKADAKQTYEQ